MNLPNENYIIDFLISIKLAEEFEKDTEKTLFDEIVDDEYKAIIDEYLSLIKKNIVVSSKFIGDNYNIWFLIYSELKSKTFDEFLVKFSELTSSEFTRIIENDPNLEYKSDLKLLDNLEIPYKDKWNLFIITSNFDILKTLAFKELASNFELYKKYVTKIEEKFMNEISSTKKYLLDRDRLYKVVFKEIINKELFDKIGNIYILPMSINEFSVLSIDDNKMACIGQYIIPYFMEIEKNKSIDTDRFFEIMKLISDPTRYEMMKLINIGITSNSVLAERFNVSRAAISKQFKNLTESEILILDDTNKTYSINTDIIIKAINNIEADFDIER